MSIRSSEEAAEYLAIADQCYWNYLRAYAPAGSTLIDSSQHVVPGQTLYSETTFGTAPPKRLGDVPWLTVFANFMRLFHGETVSFFTYELPAGVVTAQKSGEVSIA